MDRVRKVEFVIVNSVHGSEKGLRLEAGRVLCAITTDELGRLTSAGFWDAVLFALGICLTVLPPAIVAWLVSGSSSTFAFLLISMALGICLGIFSWRRHSVGGFFPAPITRGVPNLEGFTGVID